MMLNVVISGKTVNIDSINVTGIDSWDKDYSNAYIDYAEFWNNGGEKLNEKELEILNNSQYAYEIIDRIATEQANGYGDYMYDMWRESLPE